MIIYLLGKRPGPQILLVPLNDVAPSLIFSVYDWRRSVFPALKQSAPADFTDLDTIGQAYPGEDGIWNYVAAAGLAKILARVRWQRMLEPVQKGIINFLAQSGGFEIRIQEEAEI